MQIGLPGDDPVVSLLSNTAGGYGDSIATAPSELVLGELRPVPGELIYVPGVTRFNVTFSMRDALGQVVVGSPRLPIRHMVQLLVLPTSVECKFSESCETHKLQSTEVSPGTNNS